MICTPHQILVCGQIEKNKMGGYVACMGERRGIYRILVGKSEGKNHYEDPGIDGRYNIKWIFGKWDGGYILD